MKKTLAMLLAVIMVVGLFAACGKDEGKKADKGTGATPTETPEQIFTNIWNKFSEDEVFPVMGGAPETYGEMIEIDENYMMPDVPAAYDMKYKESLTSYLVIPADKLENVEAAAYAQHGMLINNFACGVLQVKGDAKAFAESVYEALLSNQWFCGQPEKLLVAVVDANHVLIGYGLEVALNPVATHLTEAYANAEILYNEAIAG